MKIILVVVLMIVMAFQTYFLNKETDRRIKAERNLDMDRMLTKVMVEEWELRDKIKLDSLDHLWDSLHMRYESMNDVVKLMRGVLDGRATRDEWEEARLFVNQWEQLHEKHLKEHEEQMQKRAGRDAERD